MSSEKEKLDKLEKRVDKHDWILMSIEKRLETMDKTLSSIDTHIQQSNTIHTEYKFFSGDVLKIQEQINALEKKFILRSEIEDYKEIKKQVANNSKKIYAASILIVALQVFFGVFYPLII